MIIVITSRRSHLQGCWKSNRGRQTNTCRLRQQSHRLIYFLLCLDGKFCVTEIPLREKKQKSLPRSDGWGLNNFDGKLIHSLCHQISVITKTYICPPRKEGFVSAISGFIEVSAFLLAIISVTTLPGLRKTLCPGVILL